MHAEVEPSATEPRLGIEENEAKERAHLELSSADALADPGENCRAGIEAMHYVTKESESYMQLFE